MKKLINFVRKTLSVSPSEARGVVFIFAAMLVLVFVPFLSDYFFSQKTQTIQILSPQKLDSLTISLDEKEPYQSAGGRSYNEHFSHEYNKHDSPKIPVKLAPFNPNTASIEDLESLGIPNFLAFRIDRYRSKGGKFRKKEDLGKIYDFPDELYSRLEPYISLPSVENESLNTPQAELTQSSVGRQSAENLATVTPKSTENVISKSNSFSKNPQKFDMNLGDTTLFKNISGIGSGYAKRIIKYRESLGGFVNAEQVRETFGLPPETADELLKYGFVKKEGIKKLKINELAIESLKHPYLRFFQTKAIIAYREQHGKFNSADELKNIKVLDEATIEKIKPYLEF